MRFAAEYEGFVPLFDFDKPRQIGNIAIHAIDAFDGDQHAAIFAADFRKQGIEGLPVVVRKWPTASAGKNRALNNAVVSQRIVNDEVARTKKVADRRFVRGVAADEADRV